jgi:single-strand DNA-binding protein
MNLNNLTMMGNLTRDPELRYAASGKAVCGLAIANNRVYTKNGEKVNEVSYFDVEVWGAAAENCSKYLYKGSGVIVEGRLRQERWEKDGKSQSRVRITANAVHFLPKKQNKNAMEPVTGASIADKQEEVQTVGVATSESVAWGE